MNNIASNPEKVKIKLRQRPLRPNRQGYIFASYSPSLDGELMAFRTGAAALCLERSKKEGDYWQQGAAFLLKTGDLHYERLSLKQKQWMAKLYQQLKAEGGNG